MKLRLNKSTRVKRVETDKAYAIKFGKSNIEFISKRHSVMMDVEKKGMYDSQQWDIVLPDWMIKNNDELKDICKFIYDWNKMNHNNTTDIWNPEKCS
jgi:hypothetical protein